MIFNFFAKRMYLVICFLIISVLFLHIGIVESSSLINYEKAAENQYLSLYINYESLEFAIKDKNNEEIWFSTPPDFEKNETIARGSTKRRIAAHFSINYFTPQGRRRTLDSFNDSIEYDQYKITKINSGVRIDYTLGKKWEDEDNLPVMINSNRFQEYIINQISDETDRNFIKSLYNLVYLEEIDDDYQRIDVYGLEKEDLFKDYTLRAKNGELDEGKKRELIQQIGGLLIEGNPNYNRLADLEFSDIKHLINNPTYILETPISAWDREDLIELIKI